MWLNTGDHDRLRRLAEALAARTWGADRSLFLVNGSSSGNHAYLLAAVGPGDEVVVGRDLHKSLLVGLILTGARPVYVAPRAHHELGLGLGVAAEDVAAALDRHPAARLVTLASSSSYYGVAADLAGVVAAAHARRVPVYVDEAWGPHLGFHPALPEGAMAAGADGAVTSAHKVLSSLSQSSLLNVRAGLVDPARVAAAVRMTQTTSPLPLLASLDACRQQLAADGQALLGQAPAPVWRPGPVPEQAMSPREAYFSPSRRVRLQDAAGEVAAELVVPYPPGIPALAPGEVIDPEVVDHLLSCRRAQVHICGPDDPTLDRVAVVDGA